MALLVELKKITFEGLKTPENHHHLALNLFRASMRGALGSGTAAAASFIFSKSSMRETSWKALAPHVFKASLTSCGTFAAVAAYIVYKLVTNQDHHEEISEKLIPRVSLFAKSSALVGLVGAAALTTKSLKIDRGLSERFVYPLLGLGLAGLTLSLFQSYQNRQLPRSPDGKLKLKLE